MWNKNYVHCLLPLVLLAGFARASESDWWDANFHYRRVVTVTDAVRGAGPSALALVEFPTLGKVNADGGDIRVVDFDGKEAAVQVLAAGLEDRACILFEAPKHGKYQLYFGNPAAKLPQRTAPLQAGLVLESRAFTEAPVDNWGQMQQVLSKNTTVTGRWWMNSPTMSFNPLGPMDHAICIFSGYIRAPKDGTYAFATNSVDASFIFVNDKPVGEWPGWHGPQGGEHATHQGKIELRAGVHKFEYITAFRGWGACTVGWQRPGDDKIAQMNGEAFAGTLIAKISAVETVSGGEADFDWSFEDDLAMEGRRVTSVKFSPLAPGKSFKWDFGDGTGSAEQFPLHIYLEPGVYSIVLTMDGKTMTQKTRVQPCRGHVGKGYEKRISAYADIIKTYATKDLSIPALLEFWQICHEAQQFDAAARALRAALEKGFAARDADEAHWIMQLYEIYRDSGHYDDAIWVCDRLADAENAPPQAVAQALTMKGEILYDYADKADAAEQEYKGVLQKFKAGTSDYVRLACIRLGELTMVKGNFKDAKKLLEDVERSEQWKKWSGDFEFVNGARDLNFEEYMRQNEFDGAGREILAWEWERPTVILSGLTRHLRGRVFLGRKMYAASIREFNRAMAADKLAPFTADALYGKAQAFEALKQKDRAVECYKRIVDEHATSKLADKAKEKLK